MEYKDEFDSTIEIEALSVMLTGAIGDESVILQ